MREFTKTLFDFFIFCYVNNLHWSLKTWKISLKICENHNLLKVNVYNSLKSLIKICQNFLNPTFNRRKDIKFQIEMGTNVPEYGSGENCSHRVSCDTQT